MRVPSHVRAVADGDGAVILDIKAGKYFGVNAVGSLIWRCIENGHDLDSICEELRAACATSPASLRSDVESFVSELTARELVQP